MSEFIVALVAVGGVIAGAIITGVLNYYSTQRTKKVGSTRANYVKHTKIFLPFIDLRTAT